MKKAKILLPKSKLPVPSPATSTLVPTQLVPFPTTSKSSAPGVTCPVSPTVGQGVKPRTPQALISPRVGVRSVVAGNVTVSSNAIPNPSKLTAKNTTVPKRPQNVVSKKAAPPSGPIAKKAAPQSGPIAKKPAPQTGPIAKNVAPQSGPIAKKSASQNGSIAKTAASQSGPIAKKFAPQSGPIVKKAVPKASPLPSLAKAPAPPKVAVNSQEARFSSVIHEKSPSPISPVVSHVHSLQYNSTLLSNLDDEATATFNLSAMNLSTSNSTSSEHCSESEDSSDIDEKASHCIPKLTFSRLARSIADEFSNVRWEEAAFETLQEAAEAYMIKMLGVANGLATHRRCVTLTLDDLNLALAIETILAPSSA